MAKYAKRDILRVRSRHILATLLLFLLPMGQAMAFFDLFKINVFSEVSGVVTMNGEPVQGASVKQWAKVSFNGSVYEHQAVTDAHGRFKFDAIYANTINRLLPSAHKVTQEAKIEHQGETYRAWVAVKNNYDYDGELNDIKQTTGERDKMKVIPKRLSDQEQLKQVIPFHLTCELTDDESIKSNDHVAAQGICKWPGLE